MTARDTTPTDRIDTDHYERSPSTGPEETTIALGARDGYDHEPPRGRAEHGGGVL